MSVRTHSTAATPDTSTVVAALAAWHPRHRETRGALSGVDRVAAHVLIETFSVLTRIPAPHRVHPRDAATAIEALPWEPIAIDPIRAARLVADAPGLSIRGGPIYDALIAITAREHGLVLLTCDARARRTYDVVGCDYLLV